MAHVSIIGTGNMGQAIAGVVRQGGNTVELLGSTDTDQPVTGDVVVLAVYYGAVAELSAGTTRESNVSTSTGVVMSTTTLPASCSSRSATTLATAP